MVRPFRYVQLRLATKHRMVLSEATFTIWEYMHLYNSVEETKSSHVLLVPLKTFAEARPRRNN